jgi:hypothetical protein
MKKYRNIVPSWQKDQHQWRYIPKGCIWSQPYENAIYYETIVDGIAHTVHGIFLEHHPEIWVEEKEAVSKKKEEPCHPHIFMDDKNLSDYDLCKKCGNFYKKEEPKSDIDWDKLKDFTAYDENIAKQNNLYFTINLLDSRINGLVDIVKSMCEKLERVEDRVDRISLKNAVGGI